jgi:bacterioferritin-associated ferredoxin
LQTLKQVIDHTGAGEGCTVCHCAIRNLLDGQCPAASSSPTCVTR